MVFATLIFIICILLFYIKIKTSSVDLDERTKKVTVLLNKFLMLAPLVGAVVFTVLLTTILQGRLAERSSHALIVFALWIYATAFYIEILKHYKNKRLLIISATGSAVSIILAIMITPLDRYYNFLYLYLHGYNFLLGLVALAFFYIGNLITRK